MQKQAKTDKSLQTDGVYARRNYRTSMHNIDPELFSVIKTMNCDILRLFFKNNSYKLKKSGITLYRQVKELNNQGFHIAYQNICKYREGKEVWASLTIINIFCYYWGCTISDMINYDLEEYDERIRDVDW